MSHGLFTGQLVDCIWMIFDAIILFARSCLISQLERPLDLETTTNFKSAVFLEAQIDKMASSALGSPIHTEGGNIVNEKEEIYLHTYTLIYIIPIKIVI